MHFLKRWSLRISNIEILKFDWIFIPSNLRHARISSIWDRENKPITLEKDVLNQKEREWKAILMWVSCGRVKEVNKQIGEIDQKTRQDADKKNKGNLMISH